MIPRTEERPNTIALKWSGHYEEGRAAADGILPGYLIETLSTQDDVPRLPPDVQAHNTQGTGTMLRIAIEDRLGGAVNSLLGKSLNTPYVGPDSDYEGDVVMYFIPQRGDVFQVRVAPQSGPWTINTPLTSAGDGTFEAVGGGDIALVEIEENIDFTDVEGDDEPLIRVRAL